MNKSGLTAKTRFAWIPFRASWLCRNLSTAWEADQRPRGIERTTRITTIISMRLDVKPETRSSTHKLSDLTSDHITSVGYVDMNGNKRIVQRFSRGLSSEFLIGRLNGEGIGLEGGILDQVVISKG